MYDVCSPGPQIRPDLGNIILYWNSSACARAARNLHATNLWYWYVYSQSIFRIQNSEYAFHSKCVFSVDFQKHASEYEVLQYIVACFWETSQQLNLAVQKPVLPPWYRRSKLDRGSNFRPATPRTACCRSSPNELLR